MPPEEVTNCFTVHGASLSYGDGHTSWQMTPDRIVCVGEATTESSGGGEDWVLCVLTDLHGTWVEASLYSTGRNDALQWLSTVLGASLEVKLANAPPFRSRVMWPRGLEDRSLFEYQAPLLRRTFSRGLRRLGLAPWRGVQTVRPAVLTYLWRTPRHTASRSA